MRRGCGAAVLVGLLLPNVAEASDWELRLEPLHLSATRLDAVYTNVAGVESRAAIRLGLGASLAWRGRLELAAHTGRGSLRTDFGLLDGPTARLERADTSFELRARVPGQLFGWTLQAGAGVGRLSLRYDPDALRLDVGGVVVDVQLDDVATWTRQTAAELLHELPGGARIVFRTAWSFYALDVATPRGSEKRHLRDVHTGVALRVALR